MKTRKEIAASKKASGKYKNLEDEVKPYITMSIENHERLW